MNQFVARTLPPSARSDEGRGVVVSPLPAPALLSPYEFYAAETQRRYRILTNAGIDEDWAFECASDAAMTKAQQLNPDDFEFCNQVYGDAK